MSDILFRALDELEKAAILGEVLRLVAVSQQPLSYFEITDAALKNLNLAEENEIGSIEVGRALFQLCISGIILSDSFWTDGYEKSLDLGSTATFRPKQSLISWLSEYEPGVSA